MPFPKWALPVTVLGLSPCRLSNIWLLIPMSARQARARSRTWVLQRTYACSETSSHPTGLSSAQSRPSHSCPCLQQLGGLPQEQLAAHRRRWDSVAWPPFATPQDQVEAPKICRPLAGCIVGVMGSVAARSPYLGERQPANTRASMPGTIRASRLCLNHSHPLAR